MFLMGNLKGINSLIYTFHLLTKKQQVVALEVLVYSTEQVLSETEIKM